MIAMFSKWRHSGFHVFCGNRVSPNDDTAMEDLARYIIRASFSQVRMRYLEQEETVVYTAKDKKTTRVFPALEWLAAVNSHIPNKGEQMVRYYGYYSNVSRGKRQKEGSDRRGYPLHPRNPGGWKDLPAELGAVDPKDLPG